MAPTVYHLLETILAKPSILSLTFPENIKRPGPLLASLRSATRPARRRGVSLTLKTNAEYFDGIICLMLHMAKVGLRDAIVAVLWNLTTPLSSHNQLPCCSEDVIILSVTSC